MLFKILLDLKAERRKELATIFSFRGLNPKDFHLLKPKSSHLFLHSNETYFLFPLCAFASLRQFFFPNPLFNFIHSFSLKYNKQPNNLLDAKAQRRKEEQGAWGFFPNSFKLISVLYFLILLLPSYALYAGPYYEAPWGKDETLVHRKECSLPPQESSIAVKLIEFHQEVISPADGPRSHFMPSSSQYTKEAIIRFGFLKGYIMGCDRLIRENSDPWVYKTGVSSEGYLMKIDPVR